ncbi:conserved hypothetical protein [Arthrobacter sp. Hiyo4]|nr:conserved hypothetical protein [Arthrobacter sp. Hiyo4]
MVQIEQLAARTPAVSVDELLKGFYPSPRFGKVSFASYRPDPNQTTQAAAVKALEAFAGGVGAGDGDGLFKKLFTKKVATRAGIYLDGGFGVGKPTCWPRCGMPPRAPRPSARLWNTLTSWGPFPSAKLLRR